MNASRLTTVTWVWFTYLTLFTLPAVRRPHQGMNASRGPIGNQPTKFAPPELAEPDQPGPAPVKTTRAGE